MKKLLFTLLCLLACVGVNAEGKSDLLDTTTLGIPTGTPEGGSYGSYTDYSYTSAVTGAEYKANACSYPSISNTPANVIQLRSKNNNSGIVTSKSGGKVTSVTVTWNAGTAASRVLNIYGSNTAFSSPADLYTADLTPVGTIANGTTTFTFTDEYEYVGIRSADGAVYLDNITIIWDGENAGGGGGDDGDDDDDTPVTPPTPSEEKEVLDNIVAASFGVPTGAGGTTYTTLTSAAMTSGAKYEANLQPNPTVGNGSVLQMRWDKTDANKRAALVSTVSGGTAKSVKVKWNAETAAQRTLAIYGSNTAYTAYTDITGETNAGEKLGEVARADADADGYTSFTFTGDYEYVGFASTYGAIYLDAIEMTWAGEGNGNGGGDTPNPPSPAEGELAKWLEAKPATNTELNASLTAVYQNGKDLWVTQGGAWALVYGDLNQTYNNGDQIPAPVTGKYEDYNGMPEFVPVASTFLAGTAGNAVAAEAVEINDITTADAARYIRLEGVNITADESDANGLNFIASDGTSTVILRNRYSKTLTITPCDDATVYGFVGVYNGAVQIYPVIIEGGDEPGPGPQPEPTEDTVTFDWTNPAGLNPAQATPGEGAEAAVNVTNVTFTEGPVSITWNMPDDLAGKSKDPRLYLYKGNVEMRAYSGTSMTVRSTATITRIEFDVNYDDNINANVSTGTLTTGKPSVWEGSAQEVTFDWTATSKCNKIIVTYTDNSGIETIETIEGPVEYYNLQGVRVENPAAGIFIRRQGNNVSKVLVK